MSGAGRAFPVAARAAIDAGQLIEAIKIVRQTHGLDLAEARDWVERERDTPGAVAPGQDRSDRHDIP